MSAAAPLTVELLDDRDRPLPGFSGPNAARVSMGGLQQEVVWPGTRAANLPAGRTVAVKVHFPIKSEAKVFALYLSDATR